MTSGRISRRSLLRAGVALPIVSALVAACGGDSSGSSSSSPTSGSAQADNADAKLAKTQKLVVRQPGEPVGFDPATLFRIDTESIAMNIYSALTSYDPKNGDPKPDLAKSWDISPDAKKYTFHLVDNAKWHQGFGDFTSADVKYSYERIIDPATGSIYTPELDNIASIETPDKYTVIVNLKTSDVNFLYQVGNYHQGQIVKKEAVQKYGAQYARNPVGLGPFEMVEWVPNTRVVLKRHEGYHKGPAKLEQITLNLITDISATEVALTNGEVALGSVGTVPERLKRLKDAKFGFSVADGNSNTIMMFNPEVGALKDKRVRQAIAYGLNTKASIQQLTPGGAVQAYSILPAWMSAYTDDLPKYDYDAKKAKSLMDEAGVKTASFKYLSQGTPTDELLLRQAQLKEIGINLDFDVVDTPVYNARRTAGSFEMAHRVYPAVNPDTLLFGYLHPSNLPPKGFNSAKYNNPKLTALLEQARSELDVAKRKDAYAQVQRIAVDDLPYLPISASQTVYGFFPWVKGVVVDRLSSVNYYPVYLEEHG